MPTPAGSPTRSTGARRSCSSPRSRPCCAGTSPIRPGPADPLAACPPVLRRPAMPPPRGAASWGLTDRRPRGRIDPGPGSPGGRPPGGSAGRPRSGAPAGNGTAPSGRLIPPRFSIERLLASPRLALNKKLLMLPGAEPQNYTEQVNDVMALLNGSYRTPDGVEAHVIPGENAGGQVWILGSSGGGRPREAGERGR